METLITKNIERKSSCQRIHCTIHNRCEQFSAATLKAANMLHPPVTRLETTRGKTSIFSILIRISPGKAMIIITSAGRGEICRSNIPAMEPRKTPKGAKTGVRPNNRGLNTVRLKSANVLAEQKGSSLIGVLKRITK